MNPDFRSTRLDDGLFVVLADDGIRFPVADPAAFFNDGRPLFNREPVGDNATPIMLAVTFPALLLAAQVFPRRAARAFVGIDPLVHGFDTDGGMVADLVWTPVFTRPGLGKANWPHLSAGHCWHSARAPSGVPASGDSHVRRGCGAIPG